MKVLPRALVAATLLSLPLAGVVSFAGAGERGVDGVITPDPVVIGEPATAAPASGDDLCFNSDRVGAAGVAEDYSLEWHVERGNPDPDADVDSGSEPLEPDGSWSAALDTSGYQAGPHLFVGECTFSGPIDQRAAAPAGAPTEVFATYLIEFTVVGGSEPTFDASLAAASGAPGEDIELTAVECVGTRGAALLMAPGPVPTFSEDLVADGLQQYDVLDGQFGGVVPVPDDAAPGTYQVVVWCIDEDVVEDTVVLGYTVLAPGAVPVPAAPSFTG